MTDGKCAQVTAPPSDCQESVLPVLRTARIASRQVEMRPVDRPQVCLLDPRHTSLPLFQFFNTNVGLLCSGAWTETSRRIIRRVPDSPSDRPSDGADRSPTAQAKQTRARAESLFGDCLCPGKLALRARIIVRLTRPTEETRRFPEAPPLLSMRCWLVARFFQGFR